MTARDRRGVPSAVVRAIGVALADVIEAQPGLPKRFVMVDGGEAALARRLTPWVERKRGKLLADDVLLAHLAAAEAFRELGSDPPDDSGLRTGVFVGTRLTSRMDRRLGDAIARAGSGGRSDSASYLRALGSGVNPVRLLSYVSHRTALHLAISLGARGPVRTYGGSGLASATALREALAALRRGEVDRAIVGGVDAGRDPVGLALEAVAGATEPAASVASFAVLERESDPPAGPCAGRLCSVEVAPAVDGAESASAAVSRALESAGLADAPRLTLALPDCASGANGAMLLLLAAGLERLTTHTSAESTRAVCSLGDARTGMAAALVLEAA